MTRRRFADTHPAASRPTLAEKPGTVIVRVPYPSTSRDAGYAQVRLIAPPWMERPDEAGREAG